jgi:homoserine O-acetyltransferase
MQEYRTYATISELPYEESKNKLVKLIPDQNITIIPEYSLESGVKLTNIPIAWKSWGKLNEKDDNCMVICHALTGSADVEDW